MHLEGVVTDTKLGATDFLHRTFEGGEQKTGDPSFDRHFRILGGPDAVGRFDHALRTRMTGAHVSLTCRDGVLTLGKGGIPPDLDTMHELLELARDVARALLDPPDLASAMHDPDARVRIQALSAWTELHLDELGPVNAALHDPDARVRLHAATLLGRSDMLIRTLADPDEPEAVRCAAIDALDPEHLAAAAQALRGAPVHKDVWSHLVKRVRYDHVEAVQALVPWVDALRSASDLREPARWANTLVTEVARRLARQAPGEVPERIFQDLLSWPDDGPRAAALYALRQVGTVDAVPSLHALKDDLGALDLSLRRQVDDTIRAIQARASGDVGGVSIAPGAGGGLSVAEAAADDEAVEGSEARHRPQRQRHPER